MSQLARDEREVPDVSDVRASPVRVFFAGLGLAAAIMLVAEMFMALVLRRLEVLVVAAPITAVFVATAGAAVALAVGRLTRGMEQRRASLVFMAAGALAGGAWGFVVFAVVANAAGTDAVTASAAAGALYAASIAGLGGLAGRYLGPFVASRPRLLTLVLVVVLLVTLGSMAFHTFVRL